MSVAFTLLGWRKNGVMKRQIFLVWTPDDINSGRNAGSQIQWRDPRVSQCCSRVWQIVIFSVENYLVHFVACFVHVMNCNTVKTPLICEIERRCRSLPVLLSSALFVPGKVSKWDELRSYNESVLKWVIECWISSIRESQLIKFASWGIEWLVEPKLGYQLVCSSIFYIQRLSDVQNQNNAGVLCLLSSYRGRAWLDVHEGY